MDHIKAGSGQTSNCEQRVKQKSRSRRPPMTDEATVVPATPLHATEKDSVGYNRSRRPPMPTPASSMGLVAACYARDSSPSNSETSIPRQIGRCDKHAAFVGALVVARYVDEDLTGKTVAGRAGLAQMLEAAEKGLFNVLIVEEVSRIGRNGEDVSRVWDRLAARGIAVHEANGSVLNAQSLALKAFLAEQEHATMLARMHDGRVLAIARGKMMGAPVYGFCRSPERAKEHVPHVHRMRVVQRVIRDLASGVPIQAVADALTAEGEMTPQDCKDLDLDAPNPDAPTRWTYLMIRQIADRIQYVGVVIDGRYRVERDPDDYRKIRYVRQDIDETVRVYNQSLIVIDRETWLVAQQAILPKFPRFQGETHQGYILSKNLFCGGCGEPVRRGINYLGQQYRCESSCEGGLKAAYTARIDGGIFEVIAAAWPRGLTVKGSTWSEPTNDAAQFVLELGRIRAELQASIEAFCRGDSTHSPQSMREHNKRLEARAAELESLILSEAPARRPMVDLSDVPGRLRALVGVEPVDLKVHPEAELLTFVESLVDRAEIVAQNGGHKITIWMSEEFHSYGETGSDRAPLEIALCPMNDDEAWCREVNEYRFARTRGELDSEDLAFTSQVQEALTQAKANSVVYARLSGVLRCLKGEPARLVAAAVGTVDRVVLAWLHVLRVQGVNTLIDFPPSQPEPSFKTLPTAIDHALVEDVYLNFYRSVKMKYKSSKKLSDPRKIGKTSTITSYLRGDSLEDIRVMTGAKSISTVVRRLSEWEFHGSIKRNLISRKVAFDDEFQSFVRATILGGHDPDDPTKVISYQILAKAINKRFGSNYTEITMPHLIGRLGLGLRQANLPPTIIRLVAEENIALVRGLPPIMET